MLELRPNCEYCDCDLPADTAQARICSYECTFCADCVDSVLHNVCPNCGGGFVPRPVRPAVVRREGTSLLHHPASLNRRTLNFSKENIREFVDSIKHINPASR